MRKKWSESSPFHESDHMDVESFATTGLSGWLT
jgi:hypothetical protein